MSNRTIFVLIIGAIFVTVLSVGLTLLFKDKTKDAIDFFTGGAFVALFTIFMGAGILMSDD